MNGDDILSRSPAWQEPRTIPLLESHQVHLWRVNLAAVALAESDLLPILSVEETARAARFLVARPRRQFIIARGILRQLLARYLGAAARELSFSLATQGKPFLSDQRFSHVRFNVSHSGDQILLAFCRQREVGVDVEHFHALQARDLVAERFFTLPEARRIRDLPAERQEYAFYHHWVRKEAFVKAAGKGIASELSHEVEVLERADECPPAPYLVAEPREQSRWRLFSFELGPDYLGALAGAGDDWSVRFWDWHPGAGA